MVRRKTRHAKRHRMERQPRNVGSTRNEELALAERVRATPLVMPQRREEPSTSDGEKMTQPSIQDTTIAVMRKLDREATAAAIWAMVHTVDAGATYAAVSSALTRGIDAGVLRRVKRGVYQWAGKPSTEEPEVSVATDQGASRVPVKNALMEYMSKRPGETLYVSDVAKDMQVDDQKIRNGIGNIRQQHGDSFPIETVIPARAFIYRPQGKDKNGAPGDVLFRLLGGPTKDGSLIVEREDGKLFLAREM